MFTKAAQRKGFTLIELLVVIVIIGILASLLLPAIIESIRGGDGVHCMNNLKQFYTACTNYLTSNKFLPTSLEGSAVWLELGRSTSNLLRISPAVSTAADMAYKPIYQCKVQQDDSTIGGDYRGPKKPWGFPPPNVNTQYLVCDKLGNHPSDRNALRVDFAVVTVSKPSTEDTGIGTPGGDTAD